MPVTIRNATTTARAVSHPRTSRADIGGEPTIVIGRQSLIASYTLGGDQPFVVNWPRSRAQTHLEKSISTTRVSVIFRLFQKA